MKVSELVSQNVGSAIENFQTWGGIAITPQKYGAKGDGVHDDTSAIQAAINTGLPVILPIGLYKISTTLTNPAKGKINLKGFGSMPDPNDPNDALYNPSTTLKWAGGASPMMKLTGPIASCTLEGITFEGMNIATYGLILDTVQFSMFTDLSVSDTITAGIWLNTIAQQGQGDINVNTMFNVFTKISTYNSPIGILLDGNPIQASNSCHNSFVGVKCDYTGAAGVYYKLSDNNAMYNVYTYHMSGAGYGVRIDAGSYSEHIYHFEGSAFGSVGNAGLMIWGFDRANGQTPPTGSGISWTEMGSGGINWNINNPIVTPTNDGALLIAGRAFERSFSLTALAGTATVSLAPAGAPAGITNTSVPVTIRPVILTLALTGNITAGQIIIKVNDNGTAIWTNTVTYPSGNNQYFVFGQNSAVATAIVNGHGLTVTIQTIGVLPAGTMNGFLTVTFDL